MCRRGHRSVSEMPCQTNSYKHPERLETIEVVDEPSLNFNSTLRRYAEHTIYRQGSAVHVRRIREGK